MGVKDNMISKQEMFNRSVRGLRGQGFKRCTVNDEPVYNDGEGCHCAWGWVDQSITSEPKNNAYYIQDLANDRVGIACQQDMYQLEFAAQLQWCHDTSYNPASMERRLRQLGLREGLKWPA